MSTPDHEGNAVADGDNVIESDITETESDHEKETEATTFQKNVEAQTFPKTNTHGRKTF